MRNDRMMEAALVYRSGSLSLTRSWTTWLALSLLTFTFAHANPPFSTPSAYSPSDGRSTASPCPASPSHNGNTGGYHGTSSTLMEPTGYGVRNSTLHPIFKQGRHPTKEQWSKYLCKVPKIQPNNVCMTPLQDLSPGENNENEWVSERDQEYCNYLGKLFSFKTSGCASVSVDAEESGTGQAYRIDACALSFSPNPNSSDIQAWYFISSKNESVPSDYKIAECPTNPLVLYQVPANKNR
uniref:Uncharacterized protein n=1 Tax=Cacopsylla melanoneura TaxID=428564 RepID=A0A8D8ZYE0_9HEMI